MQNEPEIRGDSNANEPEKRLKKELSGPKSFKIRYYDQNERLDPR